MPPRRDAWAAGPRASSAAPRRAGAGAEPRAAGPDAIWLRVDANRRRVVANRMRAGVYAWDTRTEGDPESQRDGRGHRRRATAERRSSMTQHQTQPMDTPREPRPERTMPTWALTEAELALVVGGD